MTKQRKDKHSTEFGLWLREQKDIDSSLGFISTNIDYVWRNYKNNKWMLIEEKRYMSKVEFWQKEIFDLLDLCSKRDNNYYGFHLLQFENTNPDDGKIYLDGKLIDKDHLIRFLKFEITS
jgi:hypothetical protein